MKKSCCNCGLEKMGVAGCESGICDGLLETSS